MSDGKVVVVEDYGFDAALSTEVDGLAADLTGLGLDEEELKGRLVVMGDDHFQNFVSFCTEVVTRVHLEDATKTVKSGQLWTEELLPAESVLVAICSAPTATRNGIYAATSYWSRSKRRWVAACRSAVTDGGLRRLSPGVGGTLRLLRRWKGVSLDHHVGDYRARRAWERVREVCRRMTAFRSVTGRRCGETPR